MKSARSINWTPAMDETLRNMRAAGKTWDEVGVALKLSSETVNRRGHLIGADTTRVVPNARAPAPATMLEHTAREPLPAGHPLTWGALTANTVLEGATYPHPVRTALEQIRISPNGAAGLSIRGVGA